jgi:hypothetical protein
LIGIEHTDMKMRHFLARIAAVVTAAAAIGMLLGPARADAADHEPDGSANRDLRSSMAEELGRPGGRLGQPGHGSQFV